VSAARLKSPQARSITCAPSSPASWSSASSSLTFSLPRTKGKGWTGKPFADLRSVLSLYQELVTVIVRADSHIQDLAGLAGRRVNVGSPGTGTRATWDAIEAELGWRDEERVRPIELRAEATTSALCGGAIDANLLVVGHPSPLVKTQQAACMQPGGDCRSDHR
jgi:TRAP transporter TAXI family solute receptor